MHNSTNPNAYNNGLLGSNNIGGFGYGIGVSAGILILITTILLASYFCTRPGLPSSAPPLSTRNQATAHDQPVADHHMLVLDIGLDDATISSHPKFLFSELDNYKHLTANENCCSICLGEYKNSHMVRVLPDCDHMFHVKCIDPWLKMNPTCPLCRTSPIPTPLSTPLAEVVPLASRRD